MMSKYSGPKDYDQYSPSNSPRRGRRYILENLNAKKLGRQLEPNSNNKLEYRSKKQLNEYTDIAEVPSTTASTSSKMNKYMHVGTASTVMKTDTVTPSPRKTARRDPSPRKDVPNETANETNANSPRKANETSRSRTVRNEKGLTPRDEYMVTKLYDREIIYLKPSDVRYTHDQLTAHFSDGRSMLSTFVALLHGRLEIRYGGRATIPPIEVMQTDYNGEKMWFVVNGNRRLFVFRKLQRCGGLTTMQVLARKYDTIEMDKHFLTRNQGRAISVVNDATLEAKMANEVRQWKDWKAKQTKPRVVQVQAQQNTKQLQGSQKNFHAVTDCDTTSPFDGHWKRTAWNTFLAHPEHLDELYRTGLNEEANKSVETGCH